jgi:O-antigen/teichoic acid export membrane protein
MVNHVGMSLLNNQRGASAERSYRRVFWGNMALTGAAVAAGAGFMALSGRQLLAAFGAQFDAAYPALLILMAAAIPEGLALATAQAIQSHERMWLALVGRVFPCYAVLLSVAVLVSPGLGALGLAWAYLAGWSVALAADVLIIWRTGVWSNRMAASSA